MGSVNGTFLGVATDQSIEWQASGKCANMSNDYCTCFRSKLNFEIELLTSISGVGVEKEKIEENTTQWKMK